MNWFTDEMLFWGGIITAGSSLVLLLVYFFISHSGKKRLNAKLDAEYGPKDHRK